MLQLHTLPDVIQCGLEGLQGWAGTLAGIWRQSLYHVSNRPAQYRATRAHAAAHLARVGAQVSACPAAVQAERQHVGQLDRRDRAGCKRVGQGRTVPWIRHPLPRLQKQPEALGSSAPRHTQAKQAECTQSDGSRRSPGGAVTGEVARVQDDQAGAVVGRVVHQRQHPAVVLGLQAQEKVQP